MASAADSFERAPRTEPAARASALALGALFGLIAGATLAAARGEGLALAPGLSLVWVSVAGLAWLLLFPLLGRVRAGPALVVGIVAGGVLLRGIVLGLDVGTSDDHHRYAFEGGLLLEGKSPYAAAPSSPERAAERERWSETYRGLNHPDVSAAYPPLAQVAFAAAVLAARSAHGGEGVEEAEPALRALFAGLDLLVLWPLGLLLGRRGRSRAWLALWAWSPLVALEFAGAAHLDSLAILLTLAAIAAGESGARGRAGAWLGLAALAKLLPFVLLPFLVRGARSPARVVLGFAAPCVLALVALLGLEGGLQGLGAGLAEYGFRWESTSALHRFLEPALARVFDYDEGLSDPRRLARGLEALLLLGVAAVAWRRRATPAAAAQALFGAFLVLSPTLHPWYVTWAIPWLCLAPRRSFAYLAAAAPLLYAPLAGWVERGVWREPAWLWPAVSLPFLALLARELHAPRP